MIFPARSTVRFGFVDGDEGVLRALGDPIGGMVLYVEDGRAHFHYNGFGERHTLEPVRLSPGTHAIRLEYEALGDRRGRGRLRVDETAAPNWVDLSPTLTFGIFEGLDVGLDRRGPVLRSLYERHGAFAYTGTIRDVHIHPLARPAD